MLLKDYFPSLHKKYHKQRMRGEWFKLSLQDLKNIYDNFTGNWHIVFNPEDENIFDSHMMINQKSQNINK